MFLRLLFFHLSLTRTGIAIRAFKTTFFSYKHNMYRAFKATFLDICIISPGVLSVLFKLLSFAISHLRSRRTELSIPTREAMYTAAVVNLSQIGRKMAEIEFAVIGVKRRKNINLKVVF